MGIPVLGLEAACSFPFGFGIAVCLGSKAILVLVSTGEEATGDPVTTASFSVLEIFRVGFSPAYPGILLSPGFGIPLALEATGNELDGDFVVTLGSGILEPPGTGTFDSGVLFGGAEGNVGTRDTCTGGPSGSEALDTPGLGSFDSGVLIDEGDFVNDGIRLTPIGMPVPCGGEDTPGILLLVASLGLRFTGECTCSSPFIAGCSSFGLSFRATDGIFDLGMPVLEKDGILLICLTDSCPFGTITAVGSLFSFAESSLFCDGAVDEGILLAALSFCEALSFRPAVGN